MIKIRPKLDGVLHERCRITIAEQPEKGVNDRDIQSAPSNRKRVKCEEKDSETGKVSRPPSSCIQELFDSDASMDLFHIRYFLNECFEELSVSR